MEDKLIVHARVRLVLDVKLTQAWDGSETAETIINRASREATEVTTSALAGRATLHLVQPPTVYMVIANKEEVTP